MSERIKKITIEVIEEDEVEAPTLKKGQKIPYVGKWRWVTVMNPEGIDSGNAHYDFGSSVGIEGGTIKIKAIEGDNVLCQYTAAKQAFGSHCPTGTLFFLRRKVFRKMLEEQKEVDSLKDYVTELLKKKNK